MPDKLTIELTREEVGELIYSLKVQICHDLQSCPSGSDCRKCYMQNPLYAKLKAREGKE